MNFSNSYNNKKPLSVSIIIPARNEKKFIEKCLDSIIANTYPKNKLEALVIDGMSEDGTREILKKYTQQYSFIKMADNPKKNIPCAINIGIKNAKGEITIRMDAHTTYKKDYVSKCVKFLYKYNTDNVGGVLKTVPGANTLTAKAIATSLSNWFGVGNSYFRIGSKKPRRVDTVPFFCCRKEIFEKIGLFNEKIARSEDMEFNSRLKKAGFNILLVPEIVSYYHARSDLKSFCKHNFKNGIWTIYPLKFSKLIPISFRHLIPFIFVSSIIILGTLAIFFSIFLWLFLCLIIIYFLVNIYSSIKIATKKKKIGYLCIMPVVFAGLHISYGLGSIWGLIKFLIPEKRIIVLC